MKVGITGASGFIGRHLVAKLREEGHEPVAFSRRPSPPAPGCVETRSSAPDRALDVAGLDAVVNLAGESIMGRWTAARKRRVRESRVGITARAVEAMIRARADGGGPRTLVNASAVGYYGDRSDEPLNERSPLGAGFLAEVTQSWEAAALPAEAAGIRLAKVRIGFVLGRDGGAYPMLRRAFGLGLGGPLGSGRQWMSPVHVDDLVAMILWVLKRPDAAGIYNGVGPTPVRNADFARALGAALHRPAVLRAPALALRLALGEMSQLALDSQRVLPVRSMEAGFRFRYPDLASILAELTAK